ncbi:MAG: glycogen debranching protein, partial [Deltaproteobacteria bacterium]|nr:glycogen debranching protein [Deltaproteobacteria bacterium]
TPGVLRWDLSSGEAVWILGAEIGGKAPFPARSGAASYVKRLHTIEIQRRAAFATPVHRAADAYVVQRHTGKTIVAGYPWFTDWGRDTFIAMRGICIATGRLDTAREILLEWAGTVSEGMLPNRFADAAGAPEFNAVDASLWYVVALQDFLAASRSSRKRVAAADLRTLQAAVEAILSGFAGGTRYGIRLDDDGLLAAGVAGVQLTWMDAKIGDWVVTPRIGKPVEVQALWLNAARIGSQWNQRWAAVYDRGSAAFRRRFWDAQRGWLADVVDVDHQPGNIDARLRPNQILAVGGLPYALLDGETATRVVDAVEARLLTPLGLRSLSPDEPGYVARYEGGVRERDAAYHQGTVWPWLLGAFVDAWVRVRGSGSEVKRGAHRRFVTPLLQHLEAAGLGHVSEIADAEPPFTPRGCPFQAWSVGELIRLQEVVLK